MSRYDRDYTLNLALGLVSNTSLFAKWGRNSDVDAAEDIWDGGGDYTGFPTGSAEKLEILSSDAADTAAGTGARTVRISNLLDGDKNVIDPIVVSLNGVTGVELDAAQTFSRASRVEVLTAGSGGVNAGTLTLRHVSTTTNIFAVVPIGFNNSEVACYTVPAGYKLAINKIYMGANLSGGGAQNVSAGLFVRPEGGAFRKILPIEMSSQKDFNPIGEKYFYVFNEKEDIKLRAITVSNANCIISGAFGGELVKI